MIRVAEVAEGRHQVPVSRWTWASNCRQRLRILAGAPCMRQCFICYIAVSKLDVFETDADVVLERPEFKYEQPDFFPVN
jgi:hypothetical protein